MSLADRNADDQQTWAYAPPPEMADREFRAWAELLEQRTGMQLGSDPRHGAPESTRLVDRLAVHETQFSRRRLRHRIPDHLAERLRPGGLLVIGLGEAPDWRHAEMKAQSVSGVQSWLRRDGP